MGNYSEEITKLGKNTLDKFLLLLEEDVKLRTQKIKSLDENHFSYKKKLNNFYSSNKKVKKETEEKLNEDIFMEHDHFYELTTYIMQYRKLSESQYLASNAYFIYLFAIFDQFLLAVTENVLKNNQEIMINYKNYCLNHYEKTKDKTLFKVLPFEEKLIEFLPNLSSPISISSKILNIDFKDELFITHYFKLVEMRERRNLLVHRTGFGDDTYLKSIKNHISTFPQKKRNKFMQTIENNIEKNLRIEPDYFMDSIETLYFFVCIIANYSLEKNLDKDSKINLFCEPFHDLLVNTLENKTSKTLLKIPNELLNIYREKDLKGNLSLMDDVAKVNWILINDAYKEFKIETLEKFKEVSNSEDKDAKILKYEAGINNLRESINASNKFIIEQINDPENNKIISSFLERNYANYLSCLKKYIENTDHINIEDWYMHKKLSEDIKFREMYSDFKNKNKLIYKKVKVNIAKKKQKR